MMIKQTPKLVISLLAGWLVSDLSGNNGDIVWSVQTEDAVFGSPAVSADGTIFFGSTDGVFRALDSDGSPVWSFSGATDWIESSPVLSADGEAVYFGSWDSSVYALRASDGSALWSYATGGLVIASPSLGDGGNLYIGSGDGFFYALSAEGNLLWAYPAEGPIESSGAVDSQGRIVFADTEGFVYSLNPDGSLRWRVDLREVVSSADEHGVYAALVLDQEDRIYVASRNHHLTVLDADGALEWSFHAADYLDSAPVITSDGRIYFTGRDEYLYALDANGFLEWDLFVGDVFYASPALDADGTLYVPSYAGGGDSIVQAIDSEGSVLWSSMIPGYNDASVSVGIDGSLLVGSHSGALHSIRAGAKLASFGWAKRGRDTAQSHAQLRGNFLVHYSFPHARYGSEAWYEVSWMTNGWFYAGFFPWINHLDHGWWWCGHAQPENLWVYDLQMGWLYLLPSAPGYFYNVERATWLFHQEGSSFYNTPNGRWFYSYALEDWFSVPGA